MGYRVIFLTNSSHLSIEKNCLIIDNGEKHRIPLEDIECVAVDNPAVKLNTYLLAKLSEYAITFYVTDDKHHPCGVFIPMSRHSRHLSVLEYQINMSAPTKKQLWKQIVRQKIENQATVLRLCGIDEWKGIDSIKLKVKSGDTSNMEGVAAAQYFKLLFGSNFTRTKENGINGCLNYGYAILRSTIEKYLVVYGYEPSLGLFHKSQLNNFNLADDIIETYRPLVDLFVKTNCSENTVLNSAMKFKLLDLLTHEVIIDFEDSKHFAVGRAIEITVQSLTGIFKCTRSDLILPKIEKLKKHEYE